MREAGRKVYKGCSKSNEMLAQYEHNAFRVVTWHSGMYINLRVNRSLFGLSYISPGKLTWKGECKGKISGAGSVSEERYFGP